MMCLSLPFFRKKPFSPSFTVQHACVFQAGREGDAPGRQAHQCGGRAHGAPAAAEAPAEQGQRLHGEAARGGRGAGLRPGVHGVLPGARGPVAEGAGRSRGAAVPAGQREGEEPRSGREEGS